MINLDAVAIFSILTVTGCLGLLVVVGVKVRNKIFGSTFADKNLADKTLADKPSSGDDHEKC
ncbi:MAG: hypothetical protein ACI9W6_001818 [Motiliproteus sp.]|jgi:hypothetical protein